MNEEGVEQNNLEVNTQNLVVNDIKDIDTYDATTVGVGVGSNDGAPSLNSVEYTNNTKDKEQITRATIGTGTINTQTTTGTLNRDTGNIQEITKDESSNTELYASNRTLELLDDPDKAIDNLNDKLRDVGLASHAEILKNLPSASQGKVNENGDPIREDGTKKNALENFIDDTIGEVLDTAGTAGILPSAENDGGYVTQIATQLFGDNRAGVNSSDNYLKSLGYAITRGIPTIANGGVESTPENPSPHSGYPCVIGCGDDRVTPAIENYYDPSSDERDRGEFYDGINAHPEFIDNQSNSIGSLTNIQYVEINRSR